MINPMTSFWIVHRALYKWSENGGSRMGAALAYYALFSIAPLTLIAVHIVGAIFGEEAARGEVHKQLNRFMGDDVAVGVEGLVKDASQPQDTFWTPTVSLLFLVVAALGAFLHIRGALSTIWQLDPPRGNSWLGMVWDYVLSLLMVFITAALLLLSLVFGLLIPSLQRTMQTTPLGGEQYWHYIEMGTSFVFLTLIFAVCYRTLSGGRIPWRYVWYGSIIAAVLFLAGKALLSYYIVYADPVSAYGAAGSLVVFLMWVYYSSQILFFGAELIQARRTRMQWLYGEGDGGQSRILPPP